MLDRKPAVRSVNHPLDPPTKTEIETAARLVKQHLGDTVYFCSAALQEPSKSELGSYRTGQQYPRRLRLNGYDNPPAESCDGGFDAIVDLSDQTVKLRRIESGQAPIGYADVVRAVTITKEDENWQAAMRARGVTDFKLVQIDPWPAGGYQHPSIPIGHRCHRAISFVREDPQDNGYAHPVQGLIAHVDLTLGRVAHLEDHGIVPIPEESGRYNELSQPKLREAPKSISITQPDGVGFSVNGHEIEWEGWRFRVGVHPVNGLVLYQLRIRDGETERDILSRAALSDMVVPYGDPNPMHRWKHVLDAGEASLGNCINSLTKGCDCLGEIHYLDHQLLTPDGQVRTVERAICIHEEDFGVLWKHHDAQGQTTEVRRSRRLVVSTFHTVGNYEYGFYWYLYLDGKIQMEVKLTGIVGVSGVDEEYQNNGYSHLVAKNIASPIHQHLFCFRLDFCLDGSNNSVYEVNVEPDPISPDNPDGTTFRAHENLLNSEQAAKRDADLSTSRYWKIVNTEKRNRFGNPVAYKIVPEATPKLMAAESSQVAKRAGFAKHNLWVTPYEASEMAAAGDYPNLSEGGGLPYWTEQDRDIVDTDIVVWHTVGSTHVARPEDWPVMPVEYCGFTLQPVGFFDRNPSINLPGHGHH